MYLMYSSKVGHEIAGVCTRVGPKVKNVKVGDRIGVGAQSGSCHRPECVPCSTGWENLCRTAYTGTYNGLWENGDKSFGGYSNYWVGIQATHTFRRKTKFQSFVLERRLSFCVQDS